MVQVCMWDVRDHPQQSRMEERFLYYTCKKGSSLYMYAWVVLGMNPYEQQEWRKYFAEFFPATTRMEEEFL